jgi:hypothetical protein
MAEVKPGQVWEMYSTSEKRWVRVIVNTVDDDKAKLRYEGIIEFVTVDVSEMQNNRELFRPAPN